MLDRGLVASQVALSLVLLVAAGLFLRTLGNLRAQDPGYNRGNVLMFSVDPRLAGKKADGHPADVPPCARRAAGGPGRALGHDVGSPSRQRRLLLRHVVPEFRRQDTDRDQRVRVAFNHVAPGYFATLGIPLIAGREFDERDTQGSPKVVIISERMARHFEGNPIGQRLDRGPTPRSRRRRPGRPLRQRQGCGTRSRLLPRSFQFQPKGFLLRRRSRSATRAPPRTSFPPSGRRSPAWSPR